MECGLVREGASGELLMRAGELGHALTREGGPCGKGRWVLEHVKL